MFLSPARINNATTATTDVFLAYRSEVVANLASNALPNLWDTTTANSASNPLWQKVAHPLLASSYATTYRPLSATIRVTPTGPALVQGGSGTAFYIPSNRAINAVAKWTADKIDSIESGVVEEILGKEGIVLHWTPSNDYEQVSQSVDTAISATQSTSGIGFYMIGIPKDAAFKITIDMYYEFSPSSSTGGYVAGVSDVLHPDTPYYLINYVSRHAKPLLVGKPWAYEAALAEYAKTHRLSGGMFEGNRSSGNAGRQGIFPRL
jgi:hypothetical protein